MSENKDAIKNKPKTKTERTVGWRIKWLLVIPFAVFFVIPYGVHLIANDYTFARHLPLTQRSKSRIFWRDIDTDKLETLEKTGKIEDYNYYQSKEHYIYRYFVYVSAPDDSYRYVLEYYKSNGPLAAPRISVYLPEDAKSDSNIGGTLVSFERDGSTAKNIDNPGNLSKTQLDQVTKQGLQLYNQFVDDYNDL